MPCPLFPTQQEVARGSWAHCIEDVGTVRNQELCMEMGSTVGGLPSLGAPIIPMTSPTAQPLPNPCPAKLGLR